MSSRDIYYVGEDLYVPVGMSAHERVRLPRFSGDLLRGNRVVGMGDSIMRSGTDYSTGYLGGSLLNLGCMLSKQRLMLVRNAGVSGDTTTQMLARFDTGVLFYEPDVVVILGGANDVADAGFDARTSLANLAAMAEKARRFGATPVLCTLLPRADGASAATYKANVARLNLLIKNHQYLIHPRRGYAVLDLWPVVGDSTTGGYRSGLSSDSIHPNDAGSILLGQYISDQLSSLVPARTPYLTNDPADPVNLLANGTFATDANSDGVADSWSASSAGGTVTYSRVADDAVGYWQKMAVSSNGQKFIFQSVSSGFSVGDTVALSGRLSATLIAGSMGVVAEAAFTGATSGAPQMRVLNNFTRDFTDGVVYMEGVVPPGTTSIAVRFYNTTTGTGTIQAAQLTLLNLTTLGLV